MFDSNVLYISKFDAIVELDFSFQCLGSFFLRF